MTAAEAVFVGDSGHEAMDELDGAMRVGLRPFWATWFLDRWPPGTRRMPGNEPPYSPRARPYGPAGRGPLRTGQPVNPGGVFVNGQNR